MQQARELHDILTMDLPAFADRHAPDLVTCLPNWPVDDQTAAWHTGGCGLFALALRKWSRARLALIANTHPGGGHHIACISNAAGLQIDASGLHDVNNRVWLLDRERVPVQPACALHFLREWHAFDAATQNFVGKLADRMDSEIGDGEKLFAHMPVLALDGSLLF